VSSDERAGAKSTNNPKKYGKDYSGVEKKGHSGEQYYQGKNGYEKCQVTPLEKRKHKIRGSPGQTRDAKMK